jgi:hypothetical protein
VVYDGSLLSSNQWRENNAKLFQRLGPTSFQASFVYARDLDVGNSNKGCLR